MNIIKESICILPITLDTVDYFIQYQHLESIISLYTRLIPNVTLFQLIPFRWIFWLQLTRDWVKSWGGYSIFPVGTNMHLFHVGGNLMPHSFFLYWIEYLPSQVGEIEFPKQFFHIPHSRNVACLDIDPLYILEHNWSIACSGTYLLVLSMACSEGSSYRDNWYR